MALSEQQSWALAQLLRTRPLTIEDSSVCLGMSIAEAEVLLDQLAADGHLRLAADRGIAYPNPTLQVSAEVRDRIRDIELALGDIEAGLSDLPWRVDEWGAAQGSTDGSLLLLKDLDELDAVVRLRYTGRRHEKVLLMAPTIDLLAATVTQALRQPSPLNTTDHVDILMPTDAVAGPEQREDIARLAGPTAEVRLHTEIDRWLIVTTDTVVTQSENGGFVLVQDITMTTLIRQLFDALWRHASPLDQPDDDLLVTTLADGHTMEAAARSMGISTRTAHRRLAELMALHGTKSLFALGVAWQRTRDPR